MPDSVRESLSKMVADALQQRKADAAKDYPPRPPTWGGQGFPIQADATLEGQIIDEFETRYGVRRVIVDLEGNQFVLPSASIITNELIKAKAGKGDVVWIKFLGQKESKNVDPKTGRKFVYKNFQIVIIPKDAFERTGQKFPTPKPVPKPDGSQVAAPTPQGGVDRGATQAPSQSTPTPQANGDMSKVQEVVKRLAEMAAKVGGLRKAEFEKMTKNMTGTALTADETVLMFPELVKIDGDKVLKA